MNGNKKCSTRNARLMKIDWGPDTMYSVRRCPYSEKKSVLSDPGGRGKTRVLVRSITSDPNFEDNAHDRFGTLYYYYLRIITRSYTMQITARVRT